MEFCVQLRPELRLALEFSNRLEFCVRQLLASTDLLQPVLRRMGACSPQKEPRALLNVASRQTQRKLQLQTASLGSRLATQLHVAQTVPTLHKMHAHLRLHPVPELHLLLQLALARAVTRVAAQLWPRSWPPV